MIYPAEAIVTCDAPRCREALSIYMPRDPHWTNQVHWVESELVKKHGWTVKDGKHICPITHFK